MRTRTSPLSVAATALAVLIGGVALAVVPAPVVEAEPLRTPATVPANAAATLNTSYSVPAGALFISPSGSDSNAGTQAAPFQTLSKAIKSVKQGGTIVVRGGTYRQGSSAATGYNVGGTYYFTNMPSGITIQAFPGEKPWFDGTSQITQWSRAGTDHYTASWSTPDFCAQQYYTRSPSNQATNGPCSHPDAIGGASSLGDPQMLFRNGSQLTQVRTLAEMTSANTFFYDWGNRVLHIKFDPAGQTVEATKFAQAMALYKPTNFSIKGIGFRRYASNQINTATAGAVLLNLGSTVLLENVALTENAGNGLQSWQSANLTVRRSFLSNNGANGFINDGNHQPRNGAATPADNVTVEYSRLDGNNADSFGINCSASCGAAGAKFTSTAGMTIRYNSFSRNQGGRASGFWCDLGCHNLTAYGNIFDSNDRHGLIYEISTTATIASNLFVNNGWNSSAYGGGYGMYIGSARVRIYNNTLVNNNRAVGIYDDDRSPSSNTGGYPANRIGANSAGIEFVNNIVGGGNSTDGRHLDVKGGNLNYGGNTTASQAVSLMANNSYHRPASGTAKYWIAWTETASARTEVFSTVSSFQAAKGGREQNSEISTAATNPYLTAPASGDYSVLPGPATRSARSLPGDIAALFGGGVYQSNRGVITLDGGAVLTNPTPTHTPTPTSTATPSPVVSATFDQAVGSGWGTDSRGGAWAVSGTGFSVSGGQGLLSLGKGATRSAELRSASVRNVTGSFQVGFNTTPSQEVHVNLGLRAGSDGRYLVKLRFLPGVVNVGLAKVVGSTETLLAWRSLPDTYRGGETLNVALSAVSSGTTTALNAKAWKTGQAQPSSWSVSASDGQAQLQDAGYVAISAFASPALSNAPITVRLDNLTLS